jgi:hypothetical protein
MIAALPNMIPGSQLHGILAGRPLVIMGNAWSLNDMDLDKVFAFKTLGCNRALQMDRHPDFYTVVDRDPYRREYERLLVYRGTRILSRTIYDRKVSCRRTPVQRPPPFPWYAYHAVATCVPLRGRPSMVVTTVANDRNVLHRQPIPSVCTDLDTFMPSGANIGYCMIQIALAMGANPIGIAGIDLQWQSKEKSHFFGRGASVGCFKFNTPRVLSFFAAAAMWASGHGVQVYNLSPTGVLDCFPRMNEHDFHSRFGQYRDGDLLCARQQQQPGPGGPLWVGGLPPAYHRTQPYFAVDRAGLFADGRQVGALRGMGPAQRRKVEVAHLARVNRLAQIARRKAGG